MSERLEGITIAIDEVTCTAENIASQALPSKLIDPIASFTGNLKTSASLHLENVGNLADLRVLIPEGEPGAIIEEALTGVNDNLRVTTEHGVRILDEATVRTPIPGLYFRASRTPIGIIREIVGSSLLPYSRSSHRRNP